jgi:hypothetical protein
MNSLLTSLSVASIACLFSFSSCGSSGGSSNEKPPESPSASANHVVHTTKKQENATPEGPNHIQGKWKVASTHLNALDNSLHLLTQITADPSRQLTWNIRGKEPKGSLGTLKFSQMDSHNKSVCSVELEYDLTYCCNKMRRVFLGDHPKMKNEKPAGCIESVWNISAVEFTDQLKKELGPDCHFIHHGSGVTLEGPFVDSKWSIELKAVQH